jgi:hypothetical protein
MIVVSGTSSGGGGGGGGCARRLGSVDMACAVIADLCGRVQGSSEGDACFACEDGCFATKDLLSSSSSTFDVSPLGRAARMVVTRSLRTQGSRTRF